MQHQYMTATDPQAKAKVYAETVKLVPLLQKFENDAIVAYRKGIAPAR
jgi:hypothetical protein